MPRPKFDTARNNENRHKPSAKKEKARQDRKQKTEPRRSESNTPSPASPAVTNNRASHSPDQPRQEARLDILQGSPYPVPNRPSLFQGQLGRPYQGRPEARFGPDVFSPPFNPLPFAEVYPDQLIEWVRQQRLYQQHPMGYQHPQPHNPYG
ncbi:hypothetical protein BCR34DRAFT_193861 [Clohesyomyces aquaticus]|uniref:Uncharacterized protein n=1 Tax=Clohesyomyces aquaticus TaxID=1231657 RepID=A0A1Y1YCN6_9PLEO|nr:hypothetical protein BCR34DRAFT_193861 [Clohesyomyces aquaticus]